MSKKETDFMRHIEFKLVSTFYEREVGFDIYLKVVSMSSKINRIVKIKVNMPKDKYVVKKHCKSFKDAVDSACSHLEIKRIKRKEKLR